MPPEVGESGRPLAAKLGIRAGSRVLTDGAPADVLLACTPPGAVVHRRASPGRYDVILLFATDRRRLVTRWDAHQRRLATAGRLWVAWPKQASGRQGDLGERAVRALGLERGLVDVKVCAIDRIWSGLAFTRRLTDR